MGGRPVNRVAVSGNLGGNSALFEVVAKLLRLIGMNTRPYAWLHWPSLRGRHGYSFGRKVALGNYIIKFGVTNNN
jgi:hypothetical protein